MKPRRCLHKRLQAGELVEFLVEEGSAVEYKQPVAVIAPFFGGWMNIAPLDVCGLQTQTQSPTPTTALHRFPSAILS